MTGTAWKKWVDFATSMLSIVVAGSIALTAAIARFFKLQSKMEKASNASEFALITASRLRVLEERVRAIPFDGEIEDEAQLEGPVLVSRSLPLSPSPLSLLSLSSPHPTSHPFSPLSSFLYLPHISHHHQQTRLIHTRTMNSRCTSKLTIRLKRCFLCRIS